MLKIRSRVARPLGVSRRGTTTTSAPVVLITGALSGIGRATTLSYGRDKARVVVSGRRPEAGAELAKELEALGAEAEFVQADVRFDEDVRRLVDRAVERFGRIDVAFNNAGTDGAPGPVTEITDELYTGTFDTIVSDWLDTMADLGVTL